MKKLFLGILILSILIVSGCSNTVTKYQCIDGTFVDSISGCVSRQCPSCEPKIEYQEKIIEKKVETIKYMCADGKEVSDKTTCIDYISSWDISSNKEELINKLNNIQASVSFMGDAVKVTKLTVNNNLIEISYTQMTADYLKETIGQTMFAVLQTTTNYLEEKNRLDYSIKITATASNGGEVFSKTTSTSDILKIMNYDLGMDEWIATIQ